MLTYSARWKITKQSSQCQAEIYSTRRTNEKCRWVRQTQCEASKVFFYSKTEQKQHTKQLLTKIMLIFKLFIFSWENEKDILEFPTQQFLPRYSKLSDNFHQVSMWVFLKLIKKIYTNTYLWYECGRIVCINTKLFVFILYAEKGLFNAQFMKNAVELMKSFN